MFGPKSDEPLDENIVRERFQALARDIGDGREPEAVADGFLAIAVAKMAEAIKTISVARGYDVTRYALNCFGGAGGQHACDVADALAVSTVLIHPFSSLLSAYGMGLADITAHRAQGVDEPLRVDALLRVNAVADQLADGAVAEVGEQGVAPRRSKSIAARSCAIRGRIRRSRLRSRRPGRCGARSKPRTKAASASSIERRRSSSRRCPSRRSAARRGLPRKPAIARRPRPRRSFPPARRASFRTGGGAKPAYIRASPSRAGAAVNGPALIIEPHQTIVVEQGWRAEVTAKNHVLMTRVEPVAKREAIGAKADPVMLKIFNHLFMSIAEQMGVTLQNTAYSVNIKERLDFSCARVRPRGPSHRQCAAHAGASGLDGPLGRVDHPRQ